MNEAFKIFIAGFFSAVGVAVAGILAILLGKKRGGTDRDVGNAVDRAREALDRAESTNRKFAETVDGAEDSSSRISELNERIADSVAESRRILEELKKRHPSE